MWVFLGGRAQNYNNVCEHLKAVGDLHYVCACCCLKGCLWRLWESVTTPQAGMTPLRQPARERKKERNRK